MPKMKTHRGAAKRFKKTASGKYKKRSAFRSQILTKMTAKSKRQLRRPGMVADSDTAKLDRMLPNG